MDPQTILVSQEEFDRIVELTQRPPAPTPALIRLMRRRNEESGPEPTVSFKAWFTMKMKQEPRLKAHHSDAVRAYMGGLGLKDQEPARRYDSGLRQYLGA